MNDRLLYLKCSGNSIKDHFASDVTLKAIGTCCKNLKSFWYEPIIWDNRHILMQADLLTDACIIALVDAGCWTSLCELLASGDRLVGERGKGSWH